MFISYWFFTTERGSFSIAQKNRPFGLFLVYPFTGLLAFLTANSAWDKISFT